MQEFFKKDVSLKEYNTMHIDSVAEHFLKAKNEEDLIRGVEYARENNISFLVLGGGSNIILPPKYRGVVILMEMNDFQIEEKEGKIILIADAGVTLPDASVLVGEKLGKGLEWAGGVPGTIGGAIRGNAGAFNDFIADCVITVEALNCESLKKEIFNKEECQFGYRESIFKKKRNYIILRAEMGFLKKENDDKKLEEYLDYRKENHPLDPSAGSIFKNPVVDSDFYKRFPETEKFRDLGFIPMRFLIEKCGLKGERLGGAKISEKHANFIINEQNATGEDVKQLINLIKEKIKEEFDINVKEEVEII